LPTFSATGTFFLRHRIVVVVLYGDISCLYCQLKWF